MCPQAHATGYVSMLCFRLIGARLECLCATRGCLFGPHYHCVVFCGEPRQQGAVWIRVPLATYLRRATCKTHVREPLPFLSPWVWSGIRHCAAAAPPRATDPSQTQCFPSPRSPQPMHCVAHAQALVVCTELVSAHCSLVCRAQVCPQTHGKSMLWSDSPICQQQEHFL